MSACKKLTYVHSCTYLTHPLSPHTHEQVNTNGLLSFGRPEPEYSPDHFPLLGPELVAPFWADVDTTGSGKVSYRDTSNQTLLERTRLDIQRYFEDSRRFEPSFLFIATWEQVGYYWNGTNAVRGGLTRLLTNGVVNCMISAVLVGYKTVCCSHTYAVCTLDYVSCCTISVNACGK